MPKSKRSKIYSLTQVTKNGRERKDRLFQTIRDTVPEYQHCFVFSVDNMRNSYLKNVRRELSDSRLFFGKTKLMAKALGQTPEEAVAPGIEVLAAHLSGNVGLILTNRPPAAVLEYLGSLALADFARAGVVAHRTFAVPPGIVYATAGEVPAADDVPLPHTLEPELRRLGVPVRMLAGKVVLGADEDGAGAEPYVVCKEGDVLDSRQTRLLKMFDLCLSEFRVRVLAYWSAATSQVTEVDPAKKD